MSTSPLELHLRVALKAAGMAHHEYEQKALGGKRDEAWADWYAAFVLGRMGNFTTPSRLTAWLGEAPDSDNWIGSAAAFVVERLDSEASLLYLEELDESSFVRHLGFHILHHPASNKSTAFTIEERQRYHLEGLLPARVSTQDLQMQRTLENLRREKSDIDRYIFLSLLQGRNERLYYRTLIEHTEEIMPLVYTPTVGEACKRFAHIWRQTRGFYITPEDRGQMARILQNWHEPDVRVIVITDGERILGLGDLGTNGMGIPIGKLALYTACAGIPPEQCMPVMLDVGTNNLDLLEDPLYLGTNQERVRGDAYLELVDEFMAAVASTYPRALVQFEDFVTANAFALLHRYRHQALCFNDDIQGTAAVALAGVLAALRITGLPLKDLRVLFLGAGSAATGIADLMVQALVEDGLEPEVARQRMWFVDSGGLVVSSREELAAHKRPYAHDHGPMDFVEALQDVRPHALIGATGQAGSFGRGVIERMSSFNERPIVFALSNPTSKAECTAAQAYEWSGGKVVFASGSPFPPIELDDGSIWRSGQGNNVYIFPGVGLGATGCDASRITDSMFLAAARTLAAQVDSHNLDEGSVYPPLPQIREVSLAIAVAVAEVAYEERLAQLPRPDDLRAHLQSLMYDPVY
jgi:malate dehydrogenase (oxaloacetate-decarboxylating)(NADP+)